jgi:pSer/pThr/pTyr-binding forkhead associated (FHA) protein
VPVAVVFILRAVVLVLLWGFVIAAIVAVRHDLLGDKPAKATAAAAPAGAPSPAPAAPARAKSRRREQAIARQLVVVAGEQSGTTVALGRLPVTIGRAPDCGLTLSDDYASNHHAKLVPNGDGWQLEDTGSTNGTFVADKKVSSPVAVAVGTQIRIGRTVMELRS